MSESDGLMSPQEVEAYRLAQYLRSQQAQPVAPPTAGTGAQLGTVAGQAGGLYAGNKLFGSGASQLVSDEAANAGWNQGANLASQEAWNAGASQLPTSTSVAATEPTGLAFPSLTAQTAGPLAATALGTYLAGKAGYDMLQGKRPQGLSGLAGRATLGIATGGISEILNAIMNRPTTRDIAKKHTRQLLATGKDNPAWQQYVQGMRSQFNSAPKGPAFAGKYNSWDEYKKAGLDAADLTGVYGNLKAFGPDYAGLDFERKKQITQGIIDAGLYQSKKGEVEISNADKAKAIYDQIMKTAAPKAVVGTTPTATSIVAPVQTAPSITFMDGINGTKIPVFNNPALEAYKAKKAALEEQEAARQKAARSTNAKR